MYICTYVSMYYVLCIMYYVLCMVTHIIAKVWINRIWFANPARGQLNKENEYSSVRVRACKFGLARRVSRSVPASACFVNRLDTVSLLLLQLH